jgi:tyrosine-protein kinase Etk/Wzc
MADHLNLDTLTEEPAFLTEAAQQGPDAAPGLAFIGMLTVLMRRKWLIGAVTGIGLLLGLAVSFLLPVRYTATAKIMTPQQNQSLASLLLMSQMANSGPGSLAAVAGGGLGLRNPNDLYIGLLNSRPIADGIIQKLDLAGVYHARNLTQARKKLTANTSIQSEKSGLIAISAEDGDKNRAAAIANAYTEGLHELTESLAVTEASQRRLFYEEQLKRAKDDLAAAEFAFRQIQQKKGVVQLDVQTKALIEGMASLRAQIAAKQVEVQALRSYSTEQNPNLQLAEKELSALQAQEARMEQGGRAEDPADIALEDVEGAGLDYLRAEHELQYRQILFDLLLKQYDAARLDEAKNAAVIQVVEQAAPPDLKSSPHRLMITFGFLFAGFLGACLYVLALARTRENPQLLEAIADLKRAAAE